VTGGARHDHERLLLEEGGETGVELGSRNPLAQLRGRRKDAGAFLDRCLASVEDADHAAGSHVAAGRPRRCPSPPACSSQRPRPSRDRSARCPTRSPRRDLHGEVPGVEPMHLGVGEVAQVRLVPRATVLNLISTTFPVDQRRREHVCWTRPASYPSGRNRPPGSRRPSVVAPAELQRSSVSSEIGRLLQTRIRPSGGGSSGSMW